MKLTSQRVGVFIDAENIETTGFRSYGGRTNYKKLIDMIKDREITRIIYYKPIYKEISLEFEEFWKSLGGEIKQPSKNVDSFLVVDVITMAEKLDVVVIVGGDKDYLPLLWFLKSKGCRVEIWSYPDSTANEMISSADYYFPMDDKFILKERKGHNKRDA